MFSRLVLTLLALLTGLAAQVAPAEARSREVAGVAVLLSQRAAVGQPRAAAVAELARLPVAGLRHARAVALAEPVALVPVAPLTVRTGIDRARQ